MPKNSCQNCNEIFFTSKRKSKACSPKCRTQLLEKTSGYYSSYRKRRSTAQDYTKKCQICEKTFSTRNPNQVNCSLECRKESVRLVSKKQKEAIRQNNLRPCNQCKTPISRGKTCAKCRNIKKLKRCKICSVVIKSQKTYCSDHKPRYVPTKHKKVCIGCNKSFIAKRIDAKYCNKKCRPQERARRRLSRRKSTSCKPSWQSWDELAAVERSRPSKRHHLDHIIPLNHPDVCGLHVPWNLQWLTKEENVKKSNSFDGTLENLSWKSS